jgi:hypothetical protein
VDEKEYKSAYYEVNGRPCPFDKAILTSCCGCPRSQKVLIAEREAITCLSPEGHRICAKIINALREKTLFALRLTHLSEKLPHGKELKVQCGGMWGLQGALNQQRGRVEDIHALLEEALARYGSVTELPYSEIVKSVVSYKARQRSGSS